MNDNGLAVGSRRRYGLAGSSAIMIAPPYNAVSDASDVVCLPAPCGGVASAINNRNIVVGTSGNSSGVTPASYASAFVYDGSTLDLPGALPGGLRSSGLDINEFGQVVGSSETDTLNPRVYLGRRCRHGRTGFTGQRATVGADAGRRDQRPEGHRRDRATERRQPWFSAERW